MIPTRSCDTSPGATSPPPPLGSPGAQSPFRGRRCMKMNGRRGVQPRPGVTHNPASTFPPPPPPFISCRSAATLSGDTVMMTKTNKCASGGGRRLHPAAPEDRRTPPPPPPHLYGAMKVRDEARLSSRRASSKSQSGRRRPQSSRAVCQQSGDLSA